MKLKLLINTSLLIIAPVLFVLFLNGCSTSPKSNIPNLISEEAYQSLIDKNTKHDQQYSGLTNTLDIFITYLTAEVTQGSLEKMANLYQWDQLKLNEEKLKVEKKSTQQTDFFISLYTPEKKHDDLYKNKTLWKIFLDVDGRRFEGQVSKVKLLLTEIQSLYPHHTRFASPYIITFPINSVSLKGKNLKLILTGPVGSISADFASYSSVN